MLQLWSNPRVKALVDLCAIFAGRLGGIVATLLFIPQYHLLLGSTTFGAVSIVLSLQAFFLVSDLGLATLISRDTAIARDNSDALTEVVWTRRRAEAILAIIAGWVSAVALILPKAAPSLVPWSFVDGIKVAMVIVLILTLVATNIVQLSLNALGTYQAGAAFTVLGTIARGAATVVVLGVYPNLMAFLVVQLIIAMMHFLVVRWYLEKECGPLLRRQSLFHRTAMLDLLRRCAPLMIYTLAGAAAVNLDKSIVSAFISLETAGNYFLATTYAMVPVAILSGPLNSYFSPRVIHARHAGDMLAEKRLATLYQTILMCAVVGPSLSLGFQASIWLQLWLHSVPQDTLKYVPILLAGFTISATGFYPTTYLIADGDNKYLAKLSLICGILVLAAALLFAMKNHMIGFAWSYFIFYSVGFVGLWFRLGTSIGGSRLFRFLIQSYIVPTIVIAAGYLSGFALTQRFRWEVALLAPLASAAISGLLVLTIMLLRERRFDQQHIS